MQMVNSIINYLVQKGENESNQIIISKFTQFLFISGNL